MEERKESICRNCYHSYVCEQFNENKDDNNKKCHFANDHYIPSADVVPKSELEISQHLLKEAWKRIEELDKLCGELQRKYDLAVAEREANVKGFTEELEKAKTDLDLLKSTITHKEEEAYNKGYADVKTELASEIFAEIDKNFILISIYDIGFEELKKKYTEGNQ